MPSSVLQVHRHAFSGELFPVQIQCELSKFMVTHRIENLPPLWIPTSSLEQYGPLLPNCLPPATVVVHAQKKLPLVVFSELPEDAREWLTREYSFRSKCPGSASARKNHSVVSVLEYEDRGDNKVPGIVWKQYNPWRVTKDDVQDHTMKLGNESAAATATNVAGVPSKPNRIVCTAGTSLVDLHALEYIGVNFKPASSNEWILLKEAALNKFYHCSSIQKWTRT